MSNLVHGCQSGWHDNTWPNTVIIDGSNYGVDVAGVNQALTDMNSAGGGTVMVPSNANILIDKVPISIPNRCGIAGTGTCVPGSPTFRANSSTNATSIIENTSQDGTQQMAFVRNIQIDGGGSGSGGTITNGAIWFKRLFSSSYIKDVRVVNIPSKGILIEGTDSATHGPMYVENVVVANTNDDCFVVQKGSTSVLINFLEADRPGTGKAALRIFNTAAAAAQSISVKVTNFYSEISGGVDATANFIVVDNTCNVSIDGATLSPGGTPLTAPIIIKGTGASKGGPSGFTLRNAYFEDAIFGSVLIDDQTSGAQVKAIGASSNAFRFVGWYSSPIAVGTLGNQTECQIVGVQYQKLGSSVVATGTMSIAEGNYFVISGNTTISNINTASQDSGRTIQLTFSGTPIVATGGNLKLNTQFTAAANTTLQLTSDGTNWWGGRLS